MLSGTGSNRGTKSIPRLTRFNPRLSLIGFLGTRAWALDDRPLHVSRFQMLGYQFGGKAYGHPRLIKDENGKY